jgi:hypothetical protein
MTLGKVNKFIIRIHMKHGDSQTEQNAGYLVTSKGPYQLITRKKNRKFRLLNPSTNKRTPREKC